MSMVSRVGDDDRLWLLPMSSVVAAYEHSTLLLIYHSGEKGVYGISSSQRGYSTLLLYQKNFTKI